MRNVILAAVLVAAACTVKVDKELPAGAQLSCSSVADCPTGMVCDGGAGLCRVTGNGDLANGVSCTGWGDCQSTICEHGICCETECTPEDASTCGRTGFCESNPESAQYGRCAVHSAGTACRDPICTQADAGSVGQYTPAQGCVGDGSACPAGTPAACANDVGCATATACVGACTMGTPDGCPTGRWCTDVAGTPTCAANVRANGETCSLNTHCVSGNCNGGYCCPAGKTCCNGSIAACPAAHTECNGCTAQDHAFVCGADFACQEQVTASADTGFCNGDTCYHGAADYCDTDTCCQVTCTEYGSCNFGYCDSCTEMCSCC